jgi:hypothetical protein
MDHMTDPRDMETLASIEHSSWSGWAEWMLLKIKEEVLAGMMGDEQLDPDRLEGLECVQRWRRQIATSYADLSEKEKESDRKVVREKLPIYRPHRQARAVLLSDEGIQTQLTEYANALAEIPDFLDQVKERLEILQREANKTDGSAGEYQEELERVEKEHDVQLGKIQSDFNAIVDLAIAAGVPAEQIREKVTTKLAQENERLGAASGRAAF